MRIGRVIVFPAVLMLTVAGSSLVVTAAPATAMHVSNVHLVAQGSAQTEAGIFYHC
jgi:hypothetical protein